MPANCSQLKELDAVQVLDGKRISLSIPDPVSCLELFVTFRTESILITIGNPVLSNQFFLYYVICHHHRQAPKASNQFKR